MRIATICATVGLLLCIVACGSNTSSSTGSSGGATSAGAGRIRLQGTGSTFDAPLFSKVFDAFQKQRSELPAGGPVVHVPVTMGAVAVGYNLPVDDLKLDGDTLSRIYLGTITMWNDARIAALNPTATLPSTPVAVVHRSEGSGTTFIFTSYLSAVSPDWKSKVGSAGAVKWPAGIGGKGSEGVSGQVTSTPGAVGYFELAYAKANNIKTARLKNQAGKFVEPSVAGAAAAGAGAAGNMPADLKAAFVNAPGDASYPIAGFSWVVAFKNQKDPVKGKELVDLLNYTVTRGQQYSEAFFYAPLPKAVQDLSTKAISSFNVAGK